MESQTFTLTRSQVSRVRGLISSTETPVFIRIPANPVELVSVFDRHMVKIGSITMAQAFSLK